MFAIFHTNRYPIIPSVSYITILFLLMHICLLTSERAVSDPPSYPPGITRRTASNACECTAVYCTCGIASVASVSVRVRRESWNESKNEEWRSRNNSIGNACYASLRSWRYCVVVEWTRLRRQNFNLPPTQYRQQRRQATQTTCGLQRPFSLLHISWYIHVYCK